MTPREQAEIDVAVIAADLAAARERLREAVKAEIRAMPEMADATTAETACGVLTAILGEPAYKEPDAGPNEAFCGWQVGQGGVHLRTKDLDEPIFLHVEGTEIVRAWHVDETYIRVTTTLNVALRDALLWLADRDVFLPARKS